MQFPSMLVLGLGLASTASAYVVTMYKDEDCKVGDNSPAPQRRNIYDNTCADTDFAPKSIKVEVYGGYNQKAYVYTGASCLAGTDIGGPWYADHENNKWKREGCISFDGRTLKSFGSRL